MSAFSHETQHSSPQDPNHAGHISFCDLKPGFLHRTSSSVGGFPCCRRAASLWHPTQRRRKDPTCDNTTRCFQCKGPTWAHGPHSEDTSSDLGGCRICTLSIKMHTKILSLSGCCRVDLHPRVGLGVSGHGESRRSTARLGSAQGFICEPLAADQP